MYIFLDWLCCDTLYLSLYNIEAAAKNKHNKLGRSPISAEARRSHLFCLAEKKWKKTCNCSERSFCAINFQMLENVAQKKLKTPWFKSSNRDILTWPSCCQCWHRSFPSTSWRRFWSTKVCSPAATRTWTWLWLQAFGLTTPWNMWGKKNIDTIDDTWISMNIHEGPIPILGETKQENLHPTVRGTIPVAVRAFGESSVLQQHQHLPRAALDVFLAPQEFFVQHALTLWTQQKKNRKFQLTVQDKS